MKIEHEKDKAFVQALKEAARKAFIDLLILRILKLGILP